MISVSGLTLQLGHKTIFDDVSFDMFSNYKVGLVGNNGAGKSTLLSILVDSKSIDGGNIKQANDLKIVTVKQELDNLEISVLGYAIKGVEILDKLKKEMDTANENEDYVLYANLHSDFESLGGYQIESQAAQLLSGLGFSEQQLHQNVKSLSGGWRVRLNLAQALLQKCDLLLLDEPTNHLDLDAVIWLENYLKTYDSALIVISHDRIFLDNVITKVFHIDSQKVNVYTGNYSSFENQYFSKKATQENALVKQQKNIDHLEKFINRFKAKASKAKQAQSRLKMLEKIQRISPIKSESSLDFEFETSKILVGSLIDLKNAEIGYNNTVKNIILNNVTLSIADDTRVGLLGVNGAGKSTLIKSLTGSLDLISGISNYHPNLKIGYFAQHSVESLDDNASPLQHLQRVDKNASPEKLRSFLGKFDFSNDMAVNEIKMFSGGEKSRLALAIIAYSKPNFLLLDEPTNNLDIKTREALTMALQKFQGAVLLVSHDRFLLESSVDEYWIVENKTVNRFDGDLKDYHNYKKLDVKKTTTEDGSVNLESKKNQRKNKAVLRQKLQPLKNKVDKLEKLLIKQQNELSLLEGLFADISLSGDQSLLKEHVNKCTKATAEIQKTEDEWLKLVDEYELAKNNI